MHCGGSARRARRRTTIRCGMKVGARRIALLFVATIATAVAVHNFLHLPPVLGMMTGLGYLQLFALSPAAEPSARPGTRRI